MKRILAAILAVLSVAAPAGAFELLAWPAASPSPWRMLLPGNPIGPLPPRPFPRPPLPRPQPIPQPIPRPEQSPLSVSAYSVEGTVDDRVADLTYHVTFHNPTGQRLEGVLLIPVPAESALSKFSMTVGGKEAKAELIEADKAAGIYESIVRQLRDPGLLELVGERLIRARVFPIEPGGDVAAAISLSQILPKSGELVSLAIPIQSARMVQGERGRASVRLSLKTSRPLRTLYSPNAEVKIERRGAALASVSYQEGADRTAGDLNLFFSFQEDPLAASLLTFKEEGEDGYFLLSLSPKQTVEEKDVMPKDVVFIVDRSGSMEDDGKIDQAKKALTYCIGRLSPADRFGIVDFATDSNVFESRLVPASPENKSRAKRYVSRIEAAGGTNIDAALGDGFKLLRREPGRLPLVFFLTDGLPTAGQTDIPALLKKAAEENAALRARVFTFGVGSDVNTLLLDKLSGENRGARDYVSPGENIENKVSSLYQKVAKPALTDVKLEWSGVTAEQVYPRPIDDVFYGGELAVMGRYPEGGKATLTVTGHAGSRQVKFVYPVEFPKSDSRRSFLPRLWASLKVAHELDAIRLAGKADPEIIDEIVKLAKRHGIVTPYTSFLITEEGADLHAARRMAVRQFDGLRIQAAQSGFLGGAAAAKAAQSDSKMLAMISGAAAPSSGRGDALDMAESQTRESLRAEGRSAAETRQAAGKTFYLRGGVWVDGETDLETGLKPTSVAYLSEAYFALLSAHPELARWLALGPRVDVVFSGTLYRVRP